MPEIDGGEVANTNVMIVNETGKVFYPRSDAIMNMGDDAEHGTLLGLVPAEGSAMQVGKENDFSTIGVTITFEEVDG
jgi:hypothetical protein